MLSFSHYATERIECLIMTQETFHSDKNPGNTDELHTTAFRKKRKSDPTRTKKAYATTCQISVVRESEQEPVRYLRGIFLKI